MNSIPLGTPIALVPNVAYTLPSKTVYIFPLTGLQTSDDGNQWTDYTDGSVGVKANFLRTTSDNVTVVCKSCK